MPAIPQWFFVVSVGLFGLLFGSLANVIIWRVPRGESIVAPGSHCPSCGTAIRWYDNIPIVSWIVLGARCRECGVRIAIRYPIVEALSGILWVLAAATWGMSLRTFFGVALFYLLLILTCIDLDHLRLPNTIVGVMAGFGVVGVALAQVTGAEVLPFFQGTGSFSNPVIYAVTGLAIGAGVSIAMAGTYALVRKQAGLGMGDIKLLAVLGVYFGPYVLMVLMLGSILGAPVGIALARQHTGVGAARIPFGPFLAVASVVVGVAGPAIWQWYLGLAGLG